MNSARDAEAIRDEARLVRERGLRDAQRVAGQARDMADWRHHFRRHPWVMLGAAAAIGYLVVPRRIPVIAPDAKMLEKLARKHRVVLETNPKPRPKGVVGGVFNFLSHFLLREGMGLLKQQLAAARHDPYTGDGNGRGHTAGQHHG